MGGFDDHVAVMGDWMPPSPNPGSFFLSMMNDEVSDSVNRSAQLLTEPEQGGTTGNSDEKRHTEANFKDNETSNLCAPGEPKLNSRGGLMERIAARAGFNAPRLNTESIKPADLSKKPEARSPYLTIPPGLSPTTLLDSPVFLSNSLVLPSPTTGKFSFVPSGDYRDSTLMASDSDKGKENNFDDINASSFAFKSMNESALFPYLNAANKSFPSAGFTVHSNTSLPRQSTEPTKTHLGNYSTLFQEASFSESDLGNNSPPLQQTQNSVGAEEHSPSFDEQNEDGDQRSSEDPNSVEDFYNWRKYGQKPVKGSEFPRSYYKCTHPNCPVKKKVERAQDGNITAIIYKGKHIHPMPPNRRPTLGDNLEATSSALPGQDFSNGGATEFETGDGVDAPSTFSNNEDDENQERATHGSASLGYDGEGDESESKRRRIEAYAPDICGASRPIREPRVVVQTTSEVDILDDGYRWRKYGQKVVKGNPNPRSYYKCTSPGCNVRKHVERASHDLKSVITTYEGKHNHDVPAARNSGAHVNSAPQQAVQRPEPSRTRGSTPWFERPPLGSFSIPPGPGYGYGMNQRGLAGLGYAGIGNMEPKMEPVTDAAFNSSNGSSVYQQLLSRLPLGPHM